MGDSGWGARCCDDDLAWSGVSASAPRDSDTEDRLRLCDFALRSVNDDVEPRWFCAMAAALVWRTRKGDEPIRSQLLSWKGG